MSASIALLQEKINQTIPLSQAMGYQIKELDNSHITVEAPLQPNINIHGTAFAGSLYSLATLSAWALVYHVVSEAGLHAEIVVASASIKYLAPVRGVIHCECLLNTESHKDFLDSLRNNQRARLDLVVNVGDRPDAKLLATIHATLI